jgi:hypothetical protein
MKRMNLFYFQSHVIKSIKSTKSSVREEDVMAMKDFLSEQGQSNSVGTCKGNKYFFKLPM